MTASSTCEYDFQCEDSTRCWNSTCLRLPDSLNDYCVSSLDCVLSVDTFADCVDNSCKCISDFYESKGVCLRYRMTSEVWNRIFIAMAVTFGTVLTTLFFIICSYLLVECLIRFFDVKERTILKKATPIRSRIS